jgi:hypothetical protein
VPKTTTAKKTSAKKASAKTPSAKKATTPKKATTAKKAAKKATPAKKAMSAKKATPAKKAAPAKKATAKKATAKPAKPAASSKPAKPATTTAAPSAAAGDAARALEDLAFYVRTGEDPGEALPDLLERLHANADASLLPAMFGLLDDQDTSGLLWPVFYVAEEQGDAYLQALVAALPHLQERAPGWAEIAVLRILNTRGEPEDCTASFDRAATKASAGAKTALQRLLTRMLGDTAEPLTADQRASVKATAKAIGLKVR